MPLLLANITEGKIIHHEVPGKLWEVIGAHMLTIKYQKLPFYSRLSEQIFSFQKERRPICRQFNTNMQNYLSDYGVLKEIMSDTGSNFVSNKLKQFCKDLNI